MSNINIYSQQVHKMKVGKVYVGNKRVRPKEAIINFWKAWDFLNNPQAINDFPYVYNSGTIWPLNPAYVGREITTEWLNSNCIEITQRRPYWIGTSGEYVIGISNTDNYTGLMSDLFGLYVDASSIAFYAFWATLYTGSRPQYTTNYKIKYNWATGERGIYFIHRTSNSSTNESFIEEVLIAYGIDSTYRLSIANRLQGKINLYIGSSISSTTVWDQTAIIILSNES